MFFSCRRGFLVSMSGIWLSMTSQTTLLFRRYKSMGSAASTEWLKAKEPGSDDRKAMAPKAVPCRLAALDGGKKRVKPLPREHTRPGLGQEPPVQGPADDRPRPAGKAADAQRAVRRGRPEVVDPSLERLVVLLQQLPGERGPGERIPARRPGSIAG